MAVRLNESAYEHGQRLIKDGQAVRDERDDWSEHQPTARQEDKFIEDHGLAEYRRWHQYKYFDVESAVAHLHGMLDADDAR